LWSELCPLHNPSLALYAAVNKGDRMNIADVFSDLPSLTTERLLLRRLAEADLDDLFAYTSDPEVARYIRRPLHHSRAETQEYLNTFLDAYRRGEIAPWGVEHKRDGKVIGTCGFVYWSVEHARSEVYYALSRNYWGQGYMPEAVRSVMGFGFHTMQLNRIDGTCWVENTASARVLEKVGMRFEGTLRQFVYVKGAFRDIRWYSILRDDYRNQAAGVVCDNTPKSLIDVA